MNKFPTIFLLLLLLLNLPFPQFVFHIILLCFVDMIAGEETAQLVTDVAEAWSLIRNSLELYGKSYEDIEFTFWRQFEVKEMNKIGDPICSSLIYIN